MSICKEFDKLPWIARLLLLIFLGWIISPVYRILKWTGSKNTVTLVVGILGLCTGLGNFVLEVCDVVTTALGRGITVLAD